KNEIGFYELDYSSVIIYITYYEDAEKALSEYEKMIAKISPGNSVFINPEFLTINDKQMYRCFGLGQSHYVFYNRKQLLWLTVDSRIGKDFVGKYLDYIR